MKQKWPRRPWNSILILFSNSMSNLASPTELTQKQIVTSLYKHKQKGGSTRISLPWKLHDDCEDCVSPWEISIFLANLYQCCGLRFKPYSIFFGRRYVFGRASLQQNAWLTPLKRFSGKKSGNQPLLKGSYSVSFTIVSHNL